MKNKIIYSCLFLLFSIGIITRFYNLDWGAPYFFHPDERNIAGSLVNLNFYNNLNPNFFAYGSFPIYSVFFALAPLKLLTNCFYQINSCNLSFEEAIMGIRYASAVLSILTLGLIYLIGSKFFDRTTGIAALLFSVFSIGLIQFSHFGTFETWTIFFSVLLLYLTLSLLKKKSKKLICLIGLVCGILLSIKISNLVFLSIPTVLFIYKEYRSQNKFIKKTLSLVKDFVLFFFFALIIFILTNPFTFIDFSSFKGSIDYETNVATGKLQVFYTGEFFNTIPIYFQFTKILPFIINPINTLLIIPAIIYLLINKFENKKNFYLVSIFFLVSFLSQSFLFVKWTRYTVTSIPFAYLILSLFIASIYNRYYKKHKLIIASSLLIIFLTSILFSVAYFFSTYTKIDNRVQALVFAKQNLPPDSLILTDIYDLGIITFNQDYRDIVLFDFYGLDGPGSNLKEDELKNILTNADYLIIPSQRIEYTRLSNPDKFPNGSRFYSSLKNNKNFQLIYESKCNILCKIVFLKDPYSRFEQTSNVFDNPQIKIYKIINE